MEGYVYKGFGRFPRHRGGMYRGIVGEGRRSLRKFAGGSEEIEAFGSLEGVSVDSVLI